MTLLTVLVYLCLSEESVNRIWSRADRVEKELADLQRANHIIEFEFGLLSSRRELMKSLAKDSRGVIRIVYYRSVLRLNQGQRPVE